MCSSVPARMGDSGKRPLDEKRSGIWCIPFRRSKTQCSCEGRGWCGTSPARRAAAGTQQLQRKSCAESRWPRRFPLPSGAIVALLSVERRNSQRADGGREMCRWAGRTVGPLRLGGAGTPTNGLARRHACIRLFPAPAVTPVPRVERHSLLSLPHCDGAGYRRLSHPASVRPRNFHTQKSLTSLRLPLLKKCIPASMPDALLHGGKHPQRYPGAHGAISARKGHPQGLFA